MKQERKKRPGKNSLTGRAFIFAVAALLQLVWVVLFYIYLLPRLQVLPLIVSILSVLLVLFLVNKRINPAYKLAWTILIMAFPFFGLFVYLFFGQTRFSRYMANRHKIARSQMEIHLLQQKRIADALKEENDALAIQSAYILRTTGLPLDLCEDAKYYAFGQEAYRAILAALQKAEKFIFMEFFIIAKGEFWDRVHEILREKVAAGVDVRILYDDLGCAGKIPIHYDALLRQEGIRAYRFNKIHLINSLRTNNRDHRKILVVDGNTAFTGGFNIADEYINLISPFGVWKDAGVRVTGAPVRSFTAMFLDMWSAVSGEENQIGHFVGAHAAHQGAHQGEGFVQPYCDMPFDDVFTAQNVYLNLIHGARRNLYLFTPYLVIDNEIMTALCTAAVSGIDVRIVTPGIPDKKTVNLATKSYYEQLLESGVRIYEYTPGFIHSKVMLADDNAAAVGSVNLDFRSLYLHFEDGVWIAHAPVIAAIRADMERTFAESREVLLEEVRKTKLLVRLRQGFLRVVAPVL